MEKDRALELIREYREGSSVDLLFRNLLAGDYDVNNLCILKEEEEEADNVDACFFDIIWGEDELLERILISVQEYETLKELGATEV